MRFMQRSHAFGWKDLTKRILACELRLKEVADY